MAELQARIPNLQKPWYHGKLWGLKMNCQSIVKLLCNRLGNTLQNVGQVDDRTVKRKVKWWCYAAVLDESGRLLW